MLSQAREVGEKEKESARGTMGRDGSCPALCIFFYYCYFYWDTQREFRRRGELTVP